MGGTDFGYALRKTSIKNHDFGYEKMMELSIHGHLKMLFLHIHRTTSVQSNAIEHPKGNALSRSALFNG